MQNLLEIIESIDGLAVSNYSKLCGRYERNGIVYNIRNVHGGQIKYAEVGIEYRVKELWDSRLYYPSDTTAIFSHILREFSVAVHLANDAMQLSDANTQKGLFLAYKCSNRILSNSAVHLNGNVITVSLSVKLPYNNSAYNGSFLAMKSKARKDALTSAKKGIISKQALKLLLFKNLTELSEGFVKNFDANSLNLSVCLYRNQQFIRIYLKRNHYAAFIANGSILPRKGKTDYKDAKGAVPFQSPPSMEIHIPLPNGEILDGMGIEQGITLITGDAYHGKSTILEATVKECITMRRGMVGNM